MTTRWPSPPPSSGFFGRVSTSSIPRKKQKTMGWLGSPHEPRMHNPAFHSPLARPSLKELTTDYPSQLEDPVNSVHAWKLEPTRQQGKRLFRIVRHISVVISSKKQRLGESSASFSCEPNGNLSSLLVLLNPYKHTPDRNFRIFACIFQKIIWLSAGQKKLHGFFILPTPERLNQD